MIWVFTGIVRCILSQMFQCCNEPSHSSHLTLQTSSSNVCSASNQSCFVCYDHTQTASVQAGCCWTEPRLWWQTDSAPLEQRVLTPLDFFICSHSTWTVQVLFLFVHYRIKKCFQLPFLILCFLLICCWEFLSSAHDLFFSGAEAEFAAAPPSLSYPGHIIIELMNEVIYLN